MAKYRITAPDGSKFEITAPDDATPDQVQAFAEQQFAAMQKPAAAPAPAAAPQPAAPQETRPAALRFLGDVAAGAIRGAGSIGATLLAPHDYLNDYARRRAESRTMRGMIAGPSQVNSNEERRQAMTDALAGLGFDPGSLGFGLGKVSTEVGGTLPVGSALAAGAARIPGVATAAPRVVEAIRTAGMSTGATPVGAAAKAADLGIRAAGGAITGGASAALVNPEDAAMGAAIGGGLPILTGVAGAIGGKVGSVGRGVVDAVSAKAARGTAAKQAAEALGGAPIPANASGIPLSTAALTQSPELARLEQASRIRSAAQWLPFDEAQAKAVAGKVQGATQEADQIAARAAARAQNWADNWAKASRNVDPQKFAQGLQDFRARIELAKKTPDAVNGDVMAALREIESTLDGFGSGFTATHLQKLRAEFNGKVKPMARTAIQAAPRDAPAIRTLIQGMDNLLEEATGGAWSSVRSGYAADTQALHAAKAAQIVRDKFIDPFTGMPVRAAGAAGNTPAISEAGLMQAIRQSRMPDGTSSLGPQATQELADTLGALRQQNIVQRLKRSGSAGGGSDTAQNLSSLAASMPGVPGNRILELFDAARKLGTMRRDTAMVDLLQDPAALANALTALRQPGMVSRAAADPAVQGLFYRGAPVLAADR